MKDHRIEAVMHFAALASVPLSISDPESYWRANVVGTKSVLDSMRAAGVSRIVFSSTAATYAFGAEMPIRETTPQIPETPYGTTKLAAEWMIKEYARAYGLGYTIFRYFNASGADPDGQYGESRHVEGHIIPLTLLVAVGRREKLKIFGGDWDTRDGTCVRDYVHTDDLAQAHQLAVEALGPGVARDYNLGSGTGTTILEVLRACEKAVGRPIPHEIVGRRPGDPGTLIATPEKVIKELGWSPRYPRHRVDRRDRLAMAQHPPRRLRGTRRITSAVAPGIEPFGLTVKGDVGPRNAPPRSHEQPGQPGLPASRTP